MKAYMIVTVCAIALLGAVGSPTVTAVAARPPAAGSQVPPIDNSRQGGVDPAATFAKLCAGCHGNKGQGGYGPGLTRLNERSDASLTEVITHGQGTMPAAGSQLSAAEVETLIRFIKSGFTAGPPAEAKPVEAAPVFAPVFPAGLRVDLSQVTSGEVRVQIALRSRESVPIPRAAVSLHRSTAMGGDLLMAELTTDANGEASFTSDAVEGQVVKLEAVYAGGKQWGPAKSQASLEMQSSVGAPSLISALTSRSSPPSLAAVFAALVGGVWLTYGYVAYRLLQILRLSKE